MLSKPLCESGFLITGLSDEARPGRGRASTPRLIEPGERLGFDKACARSRHPWFGTSFPVTVRAAVSPRTTRIEPGTAIVPPPWKNLLHLAEGPSGGCLHPGASAGRWPRLGLTP
jgi:alkanesulfonate monooxygenase SsuD/methylene tetrahydromethanopterin reductase-like flavin-dependent oxidoreductase (luciferase family)